MREGRKPLFIVLEGGDGSGKSTQARALSRRLREAGYRVWLTHEPGGTTLGESIRSLLKGDQGIQPLAELFLFSAARAQLVNEVIRPALHSMTVVISDRFTASTIAYQAYGRGLDLKLVQRLNHTATGGLEPNLTVFLDAPVEVGLARKHTTNDTFESAPVQFHQRVRQGYLEQASLSPDTWTVLDSTQTPKEISEQIWAKVQTLL